MTADQISEVNIGILILVIGLFAFTFPPVFDAWWALLSRARQKNTLLAATLSAPAFTAEKQRSWEIALYLLRAGSWRPLAGLISDEFSGMEPDCRRAVISGMKTYIDYLEKFDQ